MHDVVERHPEVFQFCQLGLHPPFALKKTWRCLNEPLNEDLDVTDGEACAVFLQEIVLKEVRLLCACMAVDLSDLDQ